MAPLAHLQTQQDLKTPHTFVKAEEGMPHKARPLNPQSPGALLLSSNPLSVPLPHCYPSPKALSLGVRFPRAHEETVPKTGF